MARHLHAAVDDAHAVAHEVGNIGHTTLDIESQVFLMTHARNHARKHTSLITCISSAASLANCS